MAIYDTIANELKKPPVLATIGSGIAGALSSGPSNSTTTVNPIENPQYANLGEMLRKRAEQRLMTSFNTNAAAAGGISNINQAFNGFNDTLQNDLTSRGLATSPVGAAATSNADISRRGNIASFLNTLPQQQQQAQLADMGAANDVFNSRQLGQTQTSTTTQPGGALAGGIGSAAEMLAYLMGQGAFGQQGGGSDSGSVIDTISRVLGHKPEGADLSQIAKVIQGNNVPTFGAPIGDKLPGGGIIDEAAGLAGIGATAAGTAGALGGGGAATAGAAGAGATGGAGGAGFLGLGAIPLAGQIALGLGGAYFLAKKVFGVGNTHEKANTVVQNWQNPLDLDMVQIQSELSSGATTPEQAQNAQDRLLRDYVSTLREFAGTGKEQRVAVDQAFETLRKYYAPQLQQSKVAGFIDVPKSIQDEGWF